MGSQTAICEKSKYEKKHNVWTYTNLFTITQSLFFIIQHLRRFNFVRMHINSGFKENLYIYQIRVAFQTAMDQDQEHIVEDQPLKVLNLFPKRQISALSLNYQNYSKLYQNLTCTICRQLLKSPVYLKCSHRFCKECINKYIRSSAKRSCPNCRGQLSTKRDLRCDYSLESLITYAFADVKLFSASMEEFDKIDIQRHKSIELRRLDSQGQSKQKTRQQTPEQLASIVTPSFKRTKTNDSEQPKKRRKQQSQKKIESKPLIEDKDYLPSKKSGKIANEKQTIQQPQSNIKPQVPVQSSVVSIQNFSRQKSKKKKIQIIEIQSNSAPQQHEVQEIRREQFLNTSEVGQDKNVCSISVIPEAAPQVQSSKRIFSFQEVPIQPKASLDQQKNVQMQNVGQKADVHMDVQKPQSQDSIEAQVKEANNRVIKTIQLLKEEFGDIFVQKIIQMTPFPVYTELTLKKHPNSILTPQVCHGVLKFSLRSTLQSISILISDTLNINKQSIKLYLKESNQDLNLIQANQSLKLYETNERYWKSWSDIELLELAEVINKSPKKKNLKNSLLFNRFFKNYSLKEVIQILILRFANISKSNIIHLQKVENLSTFSLQYEQYKKELRLIEKTKII